jgi:proline iminopeptidase
MATAKVKDPLYPALRTYRTGKLQVSDVHRLYFEESGNPKGQPVVFLHGGPGGGCDARMRRFFDPRRYRIVLFDQRGCGKSTPHASLVQNTTWDLVEDIEKLRMHLGIERWQVFGGSWGSTLAIAYAQKHPGRVTQMVLRGIFLLRRSELEWFYQNSEGAAALYPDGWEEFVKPIPAEERYDMIRAYYRRLTSSVARERNAAARAWSVWEGSTSFLRSSAAYIAKFKVSKYAAAFARIECHYFVNGGFLDSDDQLLRDVPKIRHIPCVIVQGRHDVVCPVRSAWHLHRAWPEAKLVIVPDAGHSAFEPGIARALRAATDAFRRR